MKQEEKKNILKRGEGKRADYLTLSTEIWNKLAEGEKCNKIKEDCFSLLS